MTELVRYIVEHLVENQDAIRITEVVEEDNVNITLSVAKEDMGKVIGKQGRVAKAIRMLLRASTRDRVFLEIVSDEVEQSLTETED